jgi:hypothetical protein
MISSVRNFLSRILFFILGITALILGAWGAIWILYQVSGYIPGALLVYALLQACRVLMHIGVDFLMRNK